MDKHKQQQNGAVFRLQANRRRAHASDWRPLLTGLAPRPPNLLVLGASGQVAGAFLLRLQAQRERFGRLVLLDPDDRVLNNVHIDQRRLEYRFIRRHLCFPGDIQYYHRLLKLHRIDIVLDLTDLGNPSVLRSCARRQHQGAQRSCD